MGRITGIDVILYKNIQTGTDPFGAPIYSLGKDALPSNDLYPAEDLFPNNNYDIVSNVLVGQPSDEEIITAVNLYGKRISYMLAIPKGDTHDWQDKIIEWTDAYGQTHRCKTFGFPITAIEANLPRRVPWHMKVRCEKFG